MKVYRGKDNNVGTIYNHVEGIRSDYTLCGLALDGVVLNYRHDLCEEDQDWDFEPMILVNGKITCPNCIEIIKYCKKIKCNNFKKY